MNYEEMSDFQINKAVSIELGHAYDGLGYIDGADGIYHVAIQWGRRVELPDYCNNPSDAWPIIFENKIAIKPCATKRSSNKEWYATNLEKITSSSQENPLRAAMIVFLMMQEQDK